jgi:hypothetical protein
MYNIYAFTNIYIYSVESMPIDERYNSRDIYLYLYEYTEIYIYTYKYIYMYNIYAFTNIYIYSVESMPIDERYNSRDKRNSVSNSGKIKQLSSTESSNIGDWFIYLYICI